jgi:thioredoxin-like negative regulator of GroEL
MRFIHVTTENNKAKTLNQLMGPGPKCADATVVLYYMDNCHHCNMIKPEWKKMIKILSRGYTGNIVIARVNANAVSTVNNSNNIEGYPTIRFISNGNTSDFDEERTSKNLLKWIELNSNKKLQKNKGTKSKTATHMTGGSNNKRRNRTKHNRSKHNRSKHNRTKHNRTKHKA